MINNAGELLFSGTINAEDPRFTTALFLDDQVLLQGGATEVAGQADGFQALGADFFPTRDEPVSLDKRFALFNLDRGPIATALARLDAQGAPLGCGGSIGPYEPNDACASAFAIGPASGPLQIGSAHVTRQVDED